MTGKLKDCTDFSLAKASKKKIKKISTNQETYPAERLCMDISHPLEKSLGGSKFWILVVCQFTKYKFVGFLKHKYETIDFMESLINKIHKMTKHIVKYIRCDNAGENTSLLGDEFEEKHPGIKMEVTSPWTPQQNGLVERSFGFLFDRVRSS